MEPKKRSNRFSSDALRLISYCPLCEASYNPLRAKVLEERGDAHLLHIQCASCGSLVVALLFNSMSGPTSIGLVTDLTSDDVLRFKDQSIVKVDEVIDLHKLFFPTEIKTLLVEQENIIV
ncbi:MAG TPA: hypothetical protein DEO26_02115 [Candidatus Veblenbacteria bacterium]|nr:hypothetical protein [Candidatus Veblenbacteria bacterium]